MIDLLVQQLPKHGGWPTKTNDILALRPFMFEHKVEFTATPDGQWFSDAYFQLVSKVQYEDALAASKLVEWSGEGLPPVGTECEWLASGDHDWMKVKVLAYHEDEVWLQPLNGAQSFTVGNPDDFRPMLTEAERKREEFAKSLCDHLDDLTDWDSPVVKAHALAIYDAIAAGKIPGVKLAD